MHHVRYGVIALVAIALVAAWAFVLTRFAVPVHQGADVLVVFVAFNGYNTSTEPVEQPTTGPIHTLPGGSGISGFVPSTTTVATTTPGIIVPKNTAQCTPTVDLNKDGKVDLADFSILAYWYHRDLTPAAKYVDLNCDGKVDLVDFSILAFYWHRL